jgi:alanyl-tRNA synthetase
VAVLFAHCDQERVQLVTGLSRDLVDKGLSANDWIQHVAKVVGGGGGGRPDLAQAGGKDPARLDDALSIGVEYVKKRLKSVD